MNWPWVSRSRYDELVSRYDELREERDRLLQRPHRETLETVAAERDRLSERVDKLTDDLTRIKRAQTGLSETPRPEREKVQPMPEKLKEYVDGFGNPSIRKQMRDEYYRAHHRGRPWDEIMDEVLEGEEPAAAAGGYR